MSTDIRLKVIDHRAKSKNSGESKTVFRSIYIPSTIYTLLGKPRSFILENLNTEEGRIVLRVAKESEEKEG